MKTEELKIERTKPAEVIRNVLFEMGIPKEKELKEEIKKLKKGKISFWASAGLYLSCVLPSFMLRSASR